MSATAETNKPLTIVAVMLSLFMGAMEATVVATAMPTAVADLGGLELYGWVGSVYLLGSTVAMPLYGKLADLYGRKRLMLLGIAIFLAGSMASGLAATMKWLIVFRAVQAVGAGALQALAFTIVGDLYTAGERARMQGLFGAVWALAGVSGPFLGGLIVRALSWRWVFFVNVPVGLVAAGLYLGAFRERVERREAHLDFGGAILLTGAVVALLLGASSVAPAIALPAAAVLGVGFVLAERRAVDPVLPLDLLSKRVIAVSSVLAVAVGATMMATVMYLPLFMQALEKASPTTAGATITPMLVGWPAASAVSGRLLARFGYRPLVRAGWLFATIGCAIVSAGVIARGGVAWLGSGMFVLGVGLGTANTPMLIAVQDVVEWKQRGVATASATFFRTIGGSIAVGGLGAVLAAPLAGTAQPHVLNDLLGPEHGRNLPREALAGISTALGVGLDRVFVIASVVVAAAFVASLLFPALRLRGAAPAPAAATERAEVPAAASSEGAATL